MSYSKITSPTLRPLLIKLENIDVKYEDLLVLKNISLDIYQGDFLYVVGPNGAGKSTLIKLITGLVKHEKGKLQINTENVGYLPQILNQRQNFPITVKEVIYTGFKKQNLFITKQDSVLISSWLEKMELSGFENKLMSHLSGGQQQRVFFIRALISNPELLILDEPTSALDPKFREIFYNILSGLNEKGTTIIFITHDINDSLNNRNVLELDQSVSFYGTYREFHTKVVHHHD